MAAIQEAIDREADPIILPALFRDGEPSIAIGASAFCWRPDILLRLEPMTPRCLIMHEDSAFEATYLFETPMQLGRVRAFGRMIAKVTGGAAFPA